MAMTAAVQLHHPVSLTRERDVFRLSFRFDPALVEQVKSLPFARFDAVSKSWTAGVYTQTVHDLRRMFYEGLVDVPVDTLLGEGEDLKACRPATLRRGTERRPYQVHIAMRGDSTFEKISSIAGASWDKKSQSVMLPAKAAAALSDFEKKGILDDVDQLLSPAETVVVFDTRTGDFNVTGPDPRAADAFQRLFPTTDVMSLWRQRGLDVAFIDPFTQEMYLGEIARAGGGVNPDGLREKLYEFQAKHVAVALERTGYGVFDAPGLGKTATGIAVGFELLRRGTVPRVVAIVPAAVRSQWAAEIARFTGATAGDIAVVDGGPVDREAAYEKAKTAQWLVVHYDILSKDKKQLKPLFAGALVVADEAHRLKNYRARRTAVTLELARGADRRLALTGTPTERNPSEFYQVLSEFTCPGVLGSVEDFNSRYRYHTKFGYEGARNLRELHERTRLYFGRNTKEQVAKHLPPLQVQQLILDPDPAYAAALKRAHREAVTEIKEQALSRSGRVRKLDPDLDDTLKTGAEMTAVGMLRLMCSSPKLVAESQADAAEALRSSGLVPDDDGPKLDELRVMLAELKAVQEQRKQWMAGQGLSEATPEMVQGERLVVFTFSKMMANLIAERLSGDGISHVVFTGDTSDRHRDEVTAAFTDPNSDVLAFIATDAAAEGLNLGRCCSTLVNFDLPWTPSRLVQRSNRIHRLDGTAPRYQVVNFVIANTMEIGVARLLEQRTDISDALLGESGGRYAATGRRGGKSILEEVLETFSPQRAASAARTAKASQKRDELRVKHTPPSDGQKSHESDDREVQLSLL